MHRARSETSLEGFAKFIALLVIWAAGAVVLYFLSLLSVSSTIINTLLGICGACLLTSLACFFTKRDAGAFLFAAGPGFLLFGIVGLSFVAGILFG